MPQHGSAEQPVAAARPGKKTKIVVDDRPLWKKKRFFIPMAVVGLIVLGTALGGTATDDSQTGTVSTASNSDGGAIAMGASDRVEISFEDIASRSDSQTDAQWEKFADELAEDYRADGWVGYVIDVREKALGDGYYVELSTDSDGLLSDFNKDLSEAEALKLSKGDRITVSGDIKFASRILTVNVELAE